MLNTRQEILEYLDGCIRHWRKRRADAEWNIKDLEKEEPDSFWGEKKEEYELAAYIARCYVDAFQSVRSSIFGETLPKEDLLPNPDTSHENADQ